MIGVRCCVDFVNNRVVPGNVHAETNQGNRTVTTTAVAAVHLHHQSSQCEAILVIHLYYYFVCVTSFSFGDVERVGREGQLRREKKHKMTTKLRLSRVGIGFGNQAELASSSSSYTRMR